MATLGSIGSLSSSGGVAPRIAQINAIEAKAIATQYNAEQTIAQAVAAVNAYSASKANLSNNSNAISSLKTVSKSLSSTTTTDAFGQTIKAEAVKQLNTAVGTIYYDQIQTIRTVATQGKFELLFDLTEQAKQDLTDYLKEQGFTLTAIPISDIANIVTLQGKSVISTATYQGTPITYVTYGNGSNMVLVTWR